MEDRSRCAQGRDEVSDWLFTVSCARVVVLGPNQRLDVLKTQGHMIQAKLPVGESASSCLFFQIGETTQVHSGGALQATPHAVRETSHPGKMRPNQTLASLVEHVDESSCLMRERSSARMRDSCERCDCVGALQLYVKRKLLAILRMMVSLPLSTMSWRSVRWMQS